MLITRLKSEETITSLCSGKVFIINCHGCKEVGFPEEEANALQKKLADAGKVVGTLTTDYVCNPTELALRLRGPMAKIAEADAVLVFSCGVGVQTISETLEDKPVYACCDTVELPGFQGVTPLEYDCGQCGECFLNPSPPAPRALSTVRAAAPRTASARSVPRWTAAGSALSSG